MNVCVCVCVCVCVSTCEQCECACVYVHIYACVCTCVVCVCMSTCECMCVYMCVCDICSTLHVHPSHPHLGVDVGVMVHQALHHLPEPPLAGHVQRGRELPLGSDGTGGAVNIRARADEEAGGGHVLEQDGAVEEGEGGAVGGTVPGVGVTAVDYLGGKLSTHLIDPLPL